MFPDQIADLFQIHHHAILFGYITRKIIINFPDKGKQALFDAIKVYAHERGSRMAKRTRLFGLEPTMENFLIFGEWFPDSTLMDQSTEQTSPTYISRVTRCPWCTFWNQEELLPYAKIYCEVIDKALVYGYNPSLSLKIDETLANGNDYCEFHWIGVNFSLENQKKMAQKREWLGNLCKRSWEFHTAHIFTTLKRELQKILGNDVLSTLESILKDFSSKFSSQHGEILKSYANYDFSSLFLPTAKISIIGFGNLMESLFPALVDMVGEANLSSNINAGNIEKAVKEYYTETAYATGHESPLSRGYGDLIEMFKEIQAEFKDMRIDMVDTRVAGDDCAYSLITATCRLESVGEEATIKRH